MKTKRLYGWRSILVLAVLGLGPALESGADPVPGGSLDPTTIPKYVIPLVIPPVMNSNGTSNSYDIAVREFRQQILPGGIWNTPNPTWGICTSLFRVVVVVLIMLTPFGSFILAIVK